MSGAQDCKSRPDKTKHRVKRFVRVNESVNQALCHSGFLTTDLGKLFSSRIPPHYPRGVFTTATWSVCHHHISLTLHQLGTRPIATRHCDFVMTFGRGKKRETRNTEEGSKSNNLSDPTSTAIPRWITCAGHKLTTSQATFSTSLCLIRGCLLEIASITWPIPA